MTVNDLAIDEAFTLRTPAGGPGKEITHVYCCDLLSMVMGKAESGDAWVTVMSNINVAAVASLSDCACVVIAEDTPADPDMLARANQEGIVVFTTALPVFEASQAIAAYLDRDNAPL